MRVSSEIILSSTDCDYAAATLVPNGRTNPIDPKPRKSAGFERANPPSSDGIEDVTKNRLPIYRQTPK
jgi:hypothetical protein